MAPTLCGCARRAGMRSMPLKIPLCTRRLYIVRMMRVKYDSCNFRTTLYSKLCSHLTFDMQTIRYNAFFLDATCVVLMYDMLRHPVKHLYNTEYIHMALQCLNTMVQDEPVTVTQHSIREMLRVVEDVISKIARPRDIATDQESLAPTTSTAVEMSNTMEQPLPNLNTQFPSFTTNASQPTQQFIHLSGLPFGTELGSVNSSAALGGSTATYANTFPYCQNDVVTTDLFNFFPMDLLSPYNISSLEGADNHTT